MDAISILLARRDLTTLGYVMAAYLVPLLIYLTSTGVAFLALAARPDRPGPTIRRGLTALILPILGPLLVLAELARRPAPNQR